MNSHSNAPVAHLTTLAEAFRKIQDPRDPCGVCHGFQGMVILIFLHAVLPKTRGG